jgi:hypothetical protein
MPSLLYYILALLALRPANNIIALPRFLYLNININFNFNIYIYIYLAYKTLLAIIYYALPLKLSL